MLYKFLNMHIHAHTEQLQNAKIQNKKLKFQHKSFLFDSRIGK